MPRWRWIGPAALVLLVLACQEQLTAPGQCPDNCPGGQLEVVDTVIIADAGRDSSFPGFVQAGFGPALLVSNGLPGADVRAVARFAPVPDSLTVRDTLRAFTIDSVILRFSIVGRDTAVKNLRLLLYRLPDTTDSTVTFNELEAGMGPATLIDSLVMPDSVAAGPLFLSLSGAALGRLGLVPGDSLGPTLGFRIAANAPTGARVASNSGGSNAPGLTAFGMVPIADTTLRKQTVIRSVIFNTFRFAAPIGFDPDRLTLGGFPAARTLIRFTLPPRLDSVDIIRATLELIPTGPLRGLANDPARLDVRGILSDLGGKSTPFAFAADTTRVRAGAADTVRVEVSRIIRLWRGDNGLPSALLLSLAPEGATFLQPEFGSTRGGGAPRLRLTYVRRFDFSRP